MSYAARKPQSRAEAEANARTLRNLVKQPENKVCADCKRNDTRWASWNIGCFLCIRCSGIHRSMGTHISRVKSIDLDMWTTEQMESMKKWGNKLVNLYWEANLKPGHMPPDHKYESRRWTLPAPPPADPSVLVGGNPAAPATGAASTAASTSTTHGAPSAPAKSNPLLDFLSDAPQPASRVAPTAAPTTVTVAPSQPAAAPRGGGLFDLDWDESPAPAASAPSSKSTKGKDDILSLFSAPPPPKQSDALFSPPAPAGSPGLNTFSAPHHGATDMLNTQDVWGAPPSSNPPKPSADDAFADIWGEFK